MTFTDKPADDGALDRQHLIAVSMGEVLTLLRRAVAETGRSAGDLVTFVIDVRDRKGRQLAAAMAGEDAIRDAIARYSNSHAFATTIIVMPRRDAIPIAAGMTPNGGRQLSEVPPPGRSWVVGVAHGGNCYGSVRLDDDA